MSRNTVFSVLVGFCLLLVGTATMVVGQEDQPVKKPDRESRQPTPEEEKAWVSHMIQRVQDRSFDGKYSGVTARAELVSELANTRDPRAVPVLIKLLGDSYADVRSAAAEGLGCFDDKSAIVPLVRTLEDTSPMVRLAAAQSLIRMRQGRNSEIFPTLAGIAKGITPEEFRWEDTGTSCDWIEGQEKEVSAKIRKGWRTRAVRIGVSIRDKLSKSQIDTLIAAVQDLTTDSDPAASKVSKWAVQQLRQEKRKKK